MKPACRTLMSHWTKTTEASQLVMQRTHCEADHNAWRWLRMEAMDEKLPQDEFDVQWSECLEVGR